MNINNITIPLEEFSVLITVYKDDDEKFFKDALHSIYHDQTVKPSEIIIVADGPLNGKLNCIIDDFTVSCLCLVRFIALDINVGLAAALNIGLKSCSNELIARMDSDDVSLPKRFQLQLEFMNERQDVDVCGTYINEVDPETLTVLDTRKVPICHVDIIAFAQKRSPMSHPSVMFKKSTVLQYGGYPDFRKSQDYALWSLLLKNGVTFANLPEVLLLMRTGRDLHKRRGLSHFKYEMKVIYFQKKIGFITQKQFLINFLGRLALRVSPVFLRKIIYKVAR